jgi:hypothetical protein
MNKTRRRAIQKHRAKAIKYEIRRKSEGDSGASRPKAATAAPSTASTASTASRAKAPTRRKEATETEE